MVAVVSDADWCSCLVRDACDPKDYELRLVPPNERAWQRISNLSPSVVAVDISGGESEAFQLLRALNTNQETEAIPVIAMAAASDALLRAAAFAAGVEDFVHRGTDPEELRSRMRTLSRLSNAVARSIDAEASLQRMKLRLRERERQLEESGRLAHHLRESNQSDSKEHQTRVEGMVQVGLDLNKVQDFHVLMDRILSEARHLTHAEAGTIFMREAKNLRFAYAQNDTLASQGVESPRFNTYTLPVSDHSIAGWVGASGETVNIADAYAIDPTAPYRFDPSFDRMSGYRTRSVLAMPLRTSLGQTVGVLQMLNAVDDRGRPRDRFHETDQAMLGHFASMATVAIERTQLTESLIVPLLRLAELNDPSETGQHIERVAGYSTALFEEWARRRGLDGPAFERQRDRLRIAAKLHDVGKVGVDKNVLRQKRRLTPSEFEQVKLHVLRGAYCFLDFNTEFTEAAREVVLNHHERWDGKGYPGHVDVNGLPIPDPRTGTPRVGGKVGDEIPLFARVVGLADVFDALSSARCYKEAWPERRVLDTIRSESGKHFDPELVEIFFTRLGSIRELRDAHPG